jgi:competence/damage-inducible protein CinA-like protein
MPSAEIISIGTELLLGEIIDTNARFLALRLRENGIDLYRKTTIGDNANRIASTIREALNRADIIITTGGLGPTVDDPTRQAVAMAIDREIEFRPELWEQIQARFRRYNRVPTENNKRQAYVPCGSIAVENPVGTAPSFIVELEEKVIISLPGVPREMEHLMNHAVIPYLKSHYQIQSAIRLRVLHTAGIGESQIDDLIQELEELENPTVGLSAHSGQVDVRITAKASSDEEAATLIAPIENQVRQLLGQWIYGADHDTLEESALQNLNKHGWKLVVYEYGSNGEFIARMARFGDPFLGGQILSSPPEPDLRLSFTAQLRLDKGVDIGLGIFIYPSGERQDIYITLVTPEGSSEVFRPYGGPAGNAPRYAVNHSLDLLRKI